MATTNELRFLITADGQKAKAEIKNVDNAINKLAGGSTAQLQRGFKSATSEASNLLAIFTGDRLTGITSQFTSFGNAIGALPGPAGLAAGAVAGIGVAGAAAVTALYSLTKAASEYGSVIHDTSQKTGLGAVTISSLKIAADQSSTSLEQMSTGLGRFAKTVGAAGDGSKEAAAKIKAFGIDPKAAVKDLDTALGKVFTRIAEARPGIEQTTLAQKAFGKSGADLIPMILSFDGNLPGLIAHMKELGLTMSDADADAADKFGDQMDTLKAQIAAAGRTIGTELMPVFSDMATAVSDWLAANKGEIASWGDETANVLRGIASLWRDAAKAIREFKAESRAGDQSPFNISGAGALTSLFPPALLAQMLASRGAAEKPDGPYGPFSWEMSKPKPGDTGGGGTAGKSAKEVFKLSAQGQAFVNVAGKLGISPLDLATIVGFETAGTYSTSKTNSVGRFGLIQMGKSEAAQYGAYKGQPFEAQLEAAGRYLIDRFAQVGKTTAGASILDLYRTVLGGNPNASLTRTDAFGTSPSSGVARMLATNRPDALKRFFGGKEGNVPKDAEYQKYLAELQKDHEKEIKDAEDAAKRRVEIGQTMTESLIDLAQHEYEANLKANDYGGAMAAARQLHDLKKQQIQDEIIALEEKYQRAEKGSDAEAEAFHQLTIAKLKGAQLERAADDELDAHKEQLHQNDLKRIDDRFKRYHNKMAALEAEAKRLDDEEEQWAEAHLKADEERRRQIESQSVVGGRGIGAGIARGAGVNLVSIFDENNQLKTGAQMIKDVYADMSDFAGQAIGSMIDGLAQLGVQFILTGQFSAKAALAMLASTAMQIATTSLMKGIFELAEAAAAAARYDFASAALHKVAAGIYFKTAAIAAAFGVGLALAGRAVGGGSSSGGGGGQGQQQGNQVNQNPTPYTRASENAYISGRRTDPALMRTLDRIHTVLDRYENAHPGDVLQRGMAQRPGLVGNQVATDIKRNAGLGRTILRSAGVT